MKNPILMVKNAGFGETPIPPDAILQPGDTLVINDANDGSKGDAVILAVVHCGGCIDRSPVFGSWSVAFSHQS